MPSSREASRRISWKSRSTSSADRLLVGSSRMSTRHEGCASARAISTSWRRAGERSATRAPLAMSWWSMAARASRVLRSLSSRRRTPSPVADSMPSSTLSRAQWRTRCRAARCLARSSGGLVTAPGTPWRRLWTAPRGALSGGTAHPRVSCARCRGGRRRKALSPACSFRHRFRRRVRGLRTPRGRSSPRRGRRWGQRISTARWR